MESKMRKLFEAVRENPELMSRLLMVAEQSGEYRTTLTRPDGAYQALAPLLSGYEMERTAILGLNRRRQIVAREVLSIGSDAYTIMCPRMVFRWALKAGASAIIVGHNHPSGDTTPSEQDKDVTRQLVKSGKVISIPVLDHIIVAADKWESMAELGLVY